MIKVNDVFCNEVEVVTSLNLIVSVLDKENNTEKYEIPADIYDYYDFNKDTNIVNDVVDRINYSIEVVNNQLVEFLKGSKIDNNTRSITFDIIDSLEIWHEDIEKYKSIKIIDVKDIEFRIEEFILQREE